jgi:hypothetical protein
MAAPVITPLNPKGKKGIQFEGFMLKIPIRMKTSRAANFTKTIKLVNRALSLIPMTRMAVRNSTMTIAGRFTIAPGAVPGVAEHQAGREIPIAFMIFTKYPDHPMATAIEETIYSSMRSQPIIQAIISPRVAYA